MPATPPALDVSPPLQPALSLPADFAHPTDGPGLFEPKVFTTARRTIRDRRRAPSEEAESPSTAVPPPNPPHLVHGDNASSVWLYHGDCLDLLDAIAAQHANGAFEMVFADPPYFLSNGGVTCRAGRRVPVDKGKWDRSGGLPADHKFNLAWLRHCQRVLKPDGTLWVTGTFHNIFSVGFALQQLGFRILNDIAWEKPNPPPNLSCRCFTHSVETLLWAARGDATAYTFNYDQMRLINGGRQMQSVWTMPGPLPEEKALGEHPTQKPLALVTRCLLAATQTGDSVLDPFLGSGTTALACLRTTRRCVGIDRDLGYVRLAAARVGAEVDRGADLFAPCLETRPPVSS